MTKAVDLGRKATKTKLILLPKSDIGHGKCCIFSFLDFNKGVLLQILDWANEIGGKGRNFI